jgi:hypothetical protein
MGHDVCDDVGNGDNGNNDAGNNADKRDGGDASREGGGAPGGGHGSGGGSSGDCGGGGGCILQGLLRVLHSSSKKWVQRSGKEAIRVIEYCVTFHNNGCSQKL